MGFCAEGPWEMNCPMFLLLQIFYRSRNAIARQVGRTGRVDHAYLPSGRAIRVFPDGAQSQYTVLKDTVSSEYLVSPSAE